jgi:hypothetical protein
VPLVPRMSHRPRESRVAAAVCRAAAVLSPCRIATALSRQPSTCGQCSSHPEGGTSREHTESATRAPQVWQTDPPENTGATKRLTPRTRKTGVRG